MLLFLVLALLWTMKPISSGEASSAVLIKSMKDTKLCNYHRTQLECLNMTEPISCDNRVYNESNCLSAEIKISNFNEKDIFSILPTIDSVTDVRRITIEVDPVVNFTRNGQRIDDFLIPRPWWKLIKEPYQWNQADKLNSVIVIERYIEKLELYYHFLQSVQYADADTFGKTRLFYSTQQMFNPGWGVILPIIGLESKKHPTRVTAMYGSTNNDVSEATAYMGADECPGEVNKWLCAFLPTTNCSFPLALTNCSTFHCTSAGGVATNATVYGEIIPHDQLKALDASPDHLPHSALQENLMNYSHVIVDLAIPRYILKDQETIKTFLKHGFGFYHFTNPSFSPFLEFLLRPNAFMRSKIARLLSKMRADHGVRESNRCVAAHVRRGDRVIKGVNMREFCEGKEVKDKVRHACHTDTPFGSITMADLIEQSAKIVDPRIRTMIVASDDEEWIIEQKELVKTTHPDWRIAFIEAPKPPSDYHDERYGMNGEYHYMRMDAGSDSGAYLFAQMSALQQCEGFLGHLYSAASKLFFFRMCVRNGLYEGVCPPHVDFSNIKKVFSK